jgi:hypothetical protein
VRCVVAEEVILSQSHKIRPLFNCPSNRNCLFKSTSLSVLGLHKQRQHKDLSDVMSRVVKHSLGPRTPKFQLGDIVLVEMDAVVKEFQVQSAKLDARRNKWEYMLIGPDRLIIEPEAPEEALCMVSETRNFLEKSKKSIDEATRKGKGKATIPEPEEANPQPATQPH